MAYENVIIAYKADISDIKSQVAEIANINKTLSQTIGSDLSKGFTILNNQLKRVQFDKQFKIQMDDGSIKNVTGALTTFEKTVQTSNGQLYNLTQTFGESSQGSQLLASSVTKINQAQNILIGQSSKLQTNFSNLTNINKNFTTQLSGFGDVTKFLGTSLNQLSDSGSKVTKIFETADGKFVQLTETTKRNSDGIQTVDRSVKELSESQIQNISTLEGMNKSSRTLGQNLSTLVKRALLTIPVWFAIRQTLSSMFKTIRDGLKNLIDFDLALQKVKRNLAGTPQEIEGNFKILRKELTDFSVKTGISTDELAESVKKFASLGFEFNEALAGGLGSAKLSILLFGDASDTADAFARSLNLLIDRSKGAKNPIDQMNELFALTAELEKTNQFEIKEVNDSLKNFAGTAKSLGISGKETLAILASLGTNLLEGARGGTLASNAFQQLINNLSEVASIVGVSVNPQTESMTEIFLKVINAIEQLGKTDIVAQTSAITKLFGGLRGAKPVRALISDLQRLKTNLQIEGDINKFNAELEKLLNTSVAELVKQFHNLNKEIGKAFVNGIIGGDDFTNTLQKLITIQSELIQKAEVFGLALSNTWKVLSFMLNSASLGGFKFAFKVVMDKREFEKQTQKLMELTQNSFENLINGINGKLSRISLERLIAEVKAKIRISKVDATVDKDAVLPQVLIQLEKQLAELPPIDVPVKMQLDKQEIVPEQASQIIESLIKNQIDRLQIDGATEVQQLKIEDALRKQYDTTYDIIKQKQMQLDIERAITEEQKQRLTFSDESVKLAEIAKTEGIQTAVALGEVLNNQRDFNTFIRQGGKNAELLRTNFEDFVKNKELENFFKGVRTPGQEFIHGGERIPINELPRQDFTPIRARTEFELEKSRLGLTEIQEQNVSALKQNTASMEVLTQAYYSGTQLNGVEAQRFMANQVGQKQIFEINVNVDGKNLKFSGTPEAIRTLASQVSSEVSKLVENKLVNDLNANNSAPISKATDGRIEKF